MEKYGVIMAGGEGTRFWPLSRKKRPKQLLKLDGEHYLIDSAVERLENCVNLDNIFIVTNVGQAEAMRQITSEKVPSSHILVEPCGRNTAACIGYAAMILMKKYGDGIMIITPSDAYIKEQRKFQTILEKAIYVAEESEFLVTIGINPTFPATRYGYIRYDKNERRSAKRVMEFKEKPDLETAIQFLESGDYVWNSGMFVWKISVILKMFQKYLPNIYANLQEIANHVGKQDEQFALNRIYPQMESISIDYGIMEKSDNIVVLPGEFGWSDVGSWDMMNAIYPENKDKNIEIGDVLNIDSCGCIGYTEKRLLVTLGMENTIVVDTDDAILVCKKDRVQDIRMVVGELERRGRIEVL